MKGIIIFEDFKKLINCKEILDGNYNCVISDYPEGTFGGVINRTTGARCNKDDTYDFETGALIALMKMCGSNKVVRACNEAFCYETDIKLLRKDNNTLREANKGLQEEVKRLKGESENRWKIYQRNVQKKQDRINELERAYKASNDDKAKLVEYYQREIKKLEEENKELKGNIDELFESEQHTKSELGRLYFEKHRLEEENENLKLDCEKLQHGYNDMMFCGGRQNGKQYKALIELFKKIPKEKVQAAYVVAYKESLIWCTSQPSIRDSIDKLNEPISKLTEDSLIKENRAFTRKCVNEWLYKIPTKREEMWEKIFELHKESDVIIKVKKENINTFLHELENKIPEITWASRVKIFETKYTIGDIYEELKTHDVIYFRLHKDNKLSYSSDPHIYPYRENNHIDYLPPMRWDLFKKGRLVVKVDADNYEDFYNKCEEEIGRKPLKACEGTFTVYYKKGTFHRRPYNDTMVFGKKIVNWEDVR